MRDLRIVTYRPADGRSVASAPVVEHVLNAAGAACLGLIVTLADVCGATVALAAATPDWPATADLSYQAIAPITEGPALAEARLVRRGSNTVVVAVDVFDGVGAEDPAAARPAGAGLMTFARIPRAAAVAVDRTGGTGDTGDTSGTSGTGGAGGDRPPGGGPVPMPARSTMARPGSRLAAPLLDRIGVRVVDAAAGHVELAKNDYVANSFGTINGGVMGMAVQAAAEAACAAPGPRLVATDIQVHYLAQVKEGPLRTRARVLRSTGEHAVCHVEAVDAGQDGLIIALASVTLQRP